MSVTVTTTDGSCCCGAGCTCATYPGSPASYPGCGSTDCADGVFANASVNVADTLGTDYSCFNQTVALTRSRTGTCCGYFTGGIDFFHPPPGCCPDPPNNIYTLFVVLSVVCGACDGSHANLCCNLTDCGVDRTSVTFGCASGFGGGVPTFNLTTVLLSTCGPRVLIVQGVFVSGGNTITITVTFT